MNYLAHLLLAGNNKHLLVGNFIADGVTKAAEQKYHPEIVKGIAMHRFIDSFTDSHPVVMETKILLRPYFGKYAPVVADVFYDHFLGLAFHQFSEITLPLFAQNTYAVLAQFLDDFPIKSKRFYEYMLQNNLLVNYSNLQGIQLVFNGMAYRAKFNSNMEKAPEILQKHFETFEAHFTCFFPELKEKTEPFRIT